MTIFKYIYIYSSYTHTHTHLRRGCSASRGVSLQTVIGGGAIQIGKLNALCNSYSHCELDWNMQPPPSQIDLPKYMQ